MSTVEFLFAILALLITPGPTNTLLALSGAAAGWRRSLPLIPAELSGYLLVVVPLALVGADLLELWPLAGAAVKLMAGAWVMYLAIKLWHPPAPDQTGGTITPRRVFITTALNPKGLIFGLVLLPRGAAPEFAPHLALFMLSIVAVAAFWAAGGALLNRDRAQGQPPMLFRRAASCWLALLSVGLVAGAVST